MLDRFVSKAESGSVRVVEASASTASLSSVISLGKRIAAFTGLALAAGVAMNGAVLADSPGHGGGIVLKDGVYHTQDSRPAPSPIVEIISKAEGRSDELAAVNTLRDIRNRIHNPFVVYTRDQMAKAQVDYQNQQTPQFIKDIVATEIGPTAATTVDYIRGEKPDLDIISSAAADANAHIAAWTFHANYRTDLSDSPVHFVHIVTPDSRTTKEEAIAELGNFPYDAIKYVPGTSFHYIAALTMHEGIGHGNQIIDPMNEKDLLSMILASEVDADRAGLATMPQEVRDAYQWGRIAGGLFVAANNTDTSHYGHSTGGFDLTYGKGIPDRQEVVEKIASLKKIGDAISDRLHGSCRGIMASCDHKVIAKSAYELLSREDAGLDAEQTRMLSKYLEGYRKYTNLPDPAAAMVASNTKSALEKFRSKHVMTDQRMAEPVDAVSTPR